MALEHTVTFHEVTEAWERIAKTGVLPGMPRQAGTTRHMRTNWSGDASWVGTSIERMRDRIENGYVAPGMDVKAGRRTVERSRFKRHEDEGELQIGLALAGDDAPYLRRTKRPHIPGIQLVIEQHGRASVPVRVLTEYAEWVARLLAGLQAKGFDLQIDVLSRVQRGCREGQSIDARIRVKRFGRRSDLRSWGALFAPGGYRMLGFTARVLACEAHGKTSTPGMGSSFTPRWDLEWDEASRTLTVRNACESFSFDAAGMDAKLAALKF